PPPCHHPIASFDPSSRVSDQLILIFVRTARPPASAYRGCVGGGALATEIPRMLVQELRECSNVSSLLHSLYDVQSLFLLVPLMPISTTPFLAVQRRRCLVPGALQFDS
ncbi:hypothetical protein BBK36DRAFT_1110569, partial [Trichoderma citrinoviride]